MFGVMETLTIISTISALVSAYKQAGGRFRFWKSRKQKTKVEEEDVAFENSLRHVPHRFQQRYDQGRSCLGLDFAKGDDIANESLSKTYNKFKKTLLEYLGLAIFSNGKPDLAHLLRISETTGQDVNSVLRDLYQRVSQAKEIPRSPSLVESSEKNLLNEHSWRNTRDVSSDAAELPADPTHQRPSLAGQVMHNKFWKGRDDDGCRMESTPSPGLSMRSRDVLAANLDRWNQLSREFAPSTFANSSALRHSSVSSATSASIVQRNKETLSRGKSV
ncbi:hypothetical protein LTR10_021908 [Elasticomyces elasticus]|uniref:Prion-inhibition and propagation HeLo domain-containing protein n=1 Tax=Exophiala sideris TaxID=1016849 RepID=A0ABR0IX43_9EURO|nr:hypothetical protein LTR10_021908 [Elasticomyces elasticus]KAK5021860.1 hypothetical protein LTS07_010601 [Exophiala sideris]KAK5025925.1 hypothetical protein LTR13_010238 [Exophiala sideris]KAK5050290.1 hypothetical protein LTR69_010625 [Exophiala sideris]KAK5177105.1 hypothetical protein LTR44_010389 [Eurotiomycetes sp. CCFEE 6388]